MTTVNCLLILFYSFNVKVPFHLNTGFNYLEYIYILRVYKKNSHLQYLINTLFHFENVGLMFGSFDKVYSPVKEFSNSIEEPKEPSDRFRQSSFVMQLPPPCK